MIKKIIVLTNTKRLIEMMNGKITVSSELGKGTTFDIILEKVEVASIDKSTLLENSKFDLNSIGFEKSSILIVDDIDYNRELVKGFLEEYNLTILEAENGKIAILEARKHNPDLIILDMKMPVMDGYEASEILKNDEMLKSIPIIALTASAMKKDQSAIHEFCDSFLKKPVSKKDLVSEIMKYLSYIQKDVIPEETAEKTESELTLKALKEYTELVKILSKDKERPTQLLKNMNLTDIELFDKEIYELGIKHNFAELSDWGQSLINAVDVFDIDIIEIELNTLVKTLMNLNP